MKALAVSNLLADKDILHIISATYYQPKTVKDLCQMFDIPIATCYRKIHELQNFQLIKSVDRIVTRKGKRMHLYKSQINSINIYYEKGKIKVKLDVAFKDTEEIIEAWDSY